MAEAKSIATLNIGSQTVSLAQFSKAKNGGLVMTKYASSQVLADPANEAARPAQLRMAISELVNKLKLDKVPLYYTLSGQTVFVRFVKLPPIDDDDLDQLIAFEAQQNVPFPLEEVVWDYHLLPEEDGEREVALVAIKSDALNEVDTLVKEAGIAKASGVEVAPISLYNSLVYNYGNLPESTVLVDIGARTMNLIFIDGAKVFIRAIPSGGASLSAAIAKEFGVDFSEAEAQKIQNGLVALGGGHTDELDEATAALATTLRNALNRVVAEIPRTINFFRSQHGGSAPKRIILGGGTAGLSYCKEFIEERLKIPVEFFNPMAKVALGKNLNPDDISGLAHQTGELVGLALRGFNKATLDIELVPAAIGKERQDKKRFPIIVGGCAAALIGSAVFAGGAFVQNKEAQLALNSIVERKSELEQPANQIIQYNQTIDQLNAIVAQFDEAQAFRVQWVDLFADFLSRTANDQLWFVDVDPMVGFELKGSDTVVGGPYYKGGLAGLSYGERASSEELPKVKPENSNQAGGRLNQMPAQPEHPQVNALRLKGLFLSSAGDGVVFQMIDQLRESPFFNLTNDEGRPLERQIVLRNISGEEAEGDFAKEFTIILPLAQPIDMPPVK